MAARAKTTTVVSTADTSATNTPQSEATAGEGAGNPASPAPAPDGSARSKNVIPDFLDREGKLRVIADDEQLAEVTMSKSVKIDGAMLEHGKTYSVPVDIWDTLDDLDVVED